jgi:hypothetical protein
LPIFGGEAFMKIFSGMWFVKHSDVPGGPELYQVRQKVIVFIKNSIIYFIKLLSQKNGTGLIRFYFTRL